MAARSAALGVLALLAASGCVEVGIPASGDKPHGELNPIQGMHAWPSYKDQEEQPFFVGKKDRGMHLPPDETSPTDFRPYTYETPEDAVAALDNPVTITDSSLRYGKMMYETNCAVCHGKIGNGEGYIVGSGERKLGGVPSLLSQRVRQWEDAHIYHVVSAGQGRMRPYRNQLKPMERWTVVNYIRALQRAQNPEPADLDRLRGE
jgi:mono/diheme cytochrome c family protein